MESIASFSAGAAMNVGGTAMGVGSSVGLKTAGVNGINELNYVTTNRFYVELGDELVACFTQMSGLGMTMKKNVYNQGGENDRQVIYLGPVQFTDVTLKRGVTNSTAFWRWAYSTIRPTGSTEKRTVSILVFNQAGQVMQRWTMFDAVAYSWKAPMMKADGATAALEELKIAYEGLDVSNGGPGGGLSMGVSTSVSMGGVSVSASASMSSFASVGASLNFG